MDGGVTTRVYRTLKFLWLLGNALSAPLAAVYAVKCPSLLVARTALDAIALPVAGVIWIIAAAMLLMYRFPLTTGRAALLLGGFVIQLAVLRATGDSITFAMFVCVYTTLAAVALCMPVLAFKAAGRTMWPGQDTGASLKIAIVAVLFIVLILPVVALFPHLAAGLAGMNRAQLLTSAGVVIFNSITTAGELIGTSVFGKPDPLDARYDEEWKHWAAPTVITLILAITSAIVLAGFLGARQA